MQQRIVCGALMAIVAGILLLSMVPDTAVARVQRMTGTITAVDPAARTVVVEVPRDQDTFTVAGPLSPDATVIKGRGTARLEDLQVGEQATVVWEETANGHEIERIEVR